MSLSVTVPQDRKYDGRAMAFLNDQQRQFVVELLQRGARPHAVKGAAKAAGYHRDYGHALMRNEAVLAAIREEASKRVVGAALVGVEVMLQIARTDGHKDQFKAAKALAELNGFTAEQRIVVEHINPDTKVQLGRVKAMAKELGLDPAQLLADAGIRDIEDGEFTEVARTALEN